MTGTKLAGRSLKIGTLPDQFSESRSMGLSNFGKSKITYYYQ
ncbi:hypothetical protein ThidrDRAFT_0601 [Thiorhodococcus drewsii AZ1]|uniref:Uncharacterized protein n=1 Tax=Thiorhodococcus drewsii AZ1 TaxID=765913 RepID=G2DX40_9GAMM|nr:hypothetical protein ThidrDRAFT_0601 [Thiorhodococcus drewsii AZ1]